MQGGKVLDVIDCTMIVSDIASLNIILYLHVVFFTTAFQPPAKQGLPGNYEE